MSDRYIQPIKNSIIVLIKFYNNNIIDGIKIFGGKLNNKKKRQQNVIKAISEDDLPIRLG